MREGKLLPTLGELDLEVFNAKRHAQELDLVLVDLVLRVVILHDGDRCVQVEHLELVLRSIRHGETANTLDQSLERGWGGLP